MYVYMYIYVCIYIYVFMCVWVVVVHMPFSYESYSTTKVTYILPYIHIDPVISLSPYMLKLLVHKMHLDDVP